LTPSEAAERLKVSPITLRSWAEKGLIHARTTLGGHRRYLVSEIDMLMQRQSWPAASQLRVMIVDDDHVVSGILQKTLARLSATLLVEIANDGFEAGRMLSSFKPDVILLDLMMPGMDGFEVCRRVKSDPATAHIRVIAVTGHPSQENLERILAAGADACLAKPVDPSALLAALQLPPT